MKDQSVLAQVPLARVNFNPPFKNLLADELKFKRGKRLCYNCDAKQTPSHRFKTTHLLVVGEEELDKLMKDERKWRSKCSRVQFL